MKMASLAQHIDIVFYFLL